MAFAGTMGKQCGDIFLCDHPWNNCSDTGAEVGCEPGVSYCFCCAIVLATSVCSWMAFGSLYPFREYGKPVVIFVLHDQ